MNNLGFLFFVFALFILGIILTCFAKTVQTYVCGLASRGLIRGTKLIKFIQSKQYLVNIRLVGVLSMLASVFLMWALLMGSWK
jgi:hypothetical protein